VWPKKITHDVKPRAQIHHVIDITPTIYEILNITLPQVVNGVRWTASAICTRLPMRPSTGVRLTI